MTKKILLSGFEAFNKRNYNPSQLVISEISKKYSLDQVNTIILPVSFERAFYELKERINSLRPDFVLCLGLADIRNNITLELKAINTIHCLIPDNDGTQIQNNKINDAGEEELYSTIPVVKLVGLLQAKNFSVSESHDAGTYVCNHLLYKTLDYSKNLNFKVGFIHLPPIPDLEPKAIGMSLNDQIEVMDEIISYLVNSLN